MQLTSERLILRPIRASDLDDLFRIYGDPATNQFNPAGPYPDKHYAESVLTAWLTHWHKNGFGCWAITSIDSPDKIIGFGGLSIRNFKNLTINNLGYRFATEAWGKGLATEFSRRAIQFGFENLRLKHISATVRENHLASQSVLIKSGLRLSGKVNDVPNVPASLMFTISAEEYRTGLN
ncbi:GNAT family N-acetyltransferase [Rouxiella sp. WC2420]|uniref:GNAT family N-acetyltransferase n=1 Tax=Rouxiella sp. WC2420 TaxID=3234145 RepID=A0AB39VVN1_9GAMM